MSSANKNGKKPREKRSINIARRNRICAGVKTGSISASFTIELVLGVAGVIEPPVTRTDGRCTITL